MAVGRVLARWQRWRVETFGERLAFARERKGLNQAELGREVGVDRSTINRWERATRSPSEPAVINKITKVLGIRLDWLLENEDPMTPEGEPGPKDEEILDLDQVFERYPNRWSLGTLGAARGAELYRKKLPASAWLPLLDTIERALETSTKTGRSTRAKKPK